MSATARKDRQVRTYRGGSLVELVGRVREEMGPNALIVRERQGLTGGFAGFFQKRCVEIDVAVAGFDAYDEDAPARPAPPAAPRTTPRAAPRPAQRRPTGHVPAAVIGEVEEAMRAGRFTDHLDAANAIVAEAAAAAPASPPAAPASVVHAAAAPAPASPPVASAAEARTDVELAEPAGGLTLDDIFGRTRPAAASTAPAPMPSQPALVVPTPLAMPAEEAPTAVERADRRGSRGLPPLRPVAPLPPEATVLVRRGLSERLAGELVQQTETHLMPFSGAGGLRPLLVAELARRIPIAAIARQGRVAGFVGPGGSGKTRCIARLAHAYAARSSLEVACITLRPEDGGSQLAQLLAPAGVVLHVAPDAATARERVEALRGHALVLVDTPGVSPRAEAELRVLAAELHQLALDETHLAVPATTGPDAARELLRGMEPLGVTCMTLTHTDETEVLGTGVELAIDTSVPLSYIARGTRVTGGIAPASAPDLAEALLA
jgi:flagellar biosynthesis protein FlhF